MVEPDPKLNPYAPTLSDDEATAVSSPTTSVGATAETDPAESISRTGLRWLVVCSLSALPSFVWGIAVTKGQVLGMLAGILVFVIGYTILDHRTAAWPIRRRSTLRRTLRITYGTRIAISILFPIGGYLDLVCGIISIEITQIVLEQQLTSPDPMQFGSTFFTTLVQGVVLNLVLACYAMLVHTVQWIVLALRR